MSNVKFRMAARCEAAGRPNNEDNYQLDADLSDNEWGFTADKPIDLGKKGALLVVCDGMGGMNAGEVASDIAVSTIKEWFTSDKLTEEVLTSPMAYIKQAIIAADSAIKAHSKTHPETEGMGSTIVMAWMLGKKVYVGWCGDSRCYCYNPKAGLVRLSHDHSYVQELVDAGKLTEDLAFDHPNNNIITRSLGDPNGTARPDVKEFDLHNEDILLLCSDGLCGCLRDKEIEELLTAHQTSMQDCRDALWVADEAAGWHDNVTIALAQIISGGLTSQHAASATDQLDALKKTIKHLKNVNWLLGLILFFIVVVCAVDYYPRVVNYLKSHPIQFFNGKGNSGECRTEDAGVSPVTNNIVADSMSSQIEGEVPVTEKTTAEKVSKEKEKNINLLNQLSPEVQKVQSDTTALDHSTPVQTITNEAAISQTKTAEKVDNNQQVPTHNTDTVDYSTESQTLELPSQVSKHILEGQQGNRHTIENPSK